MKVVAGITLIFSILGLVATLHVSENNAGYGVMLKLMLLLLSLCSGIFAMLFLILY